MTTGEKFIYCPRCATRLVESFVHGALRPVCPQCSYIQFLDPKLVTIVVIEYEGNILLGRRNIEPGRGANALPDLTRRFDSHTKTAEVS